LGRKRRERGYEWDGREEVEGGKWGEREGREDGSGMRVMRWKVGSGENERRGREEGGVREGKRWKQEERGRRGGMRWKVGSGKGERGERSEAGRGVMRCPESGKREG